MYVLVLIAQLTLPPLPPALSLEPTLPRNLRIDSTSPITLAPDPDYDDALASFTERHKDGKSKTYVGKTLQPQPSHSVPFPSHLPQAVQPIDTAVMTWQCVGGVCQWLPVAQAPTKSAQPQRSNQRSRFRLFRRR